MKKFNYFTASIIVILFIIMTRIFYIVVAEKYTISAEDIIGVALLAFGIRLLVTQSVAGEYVILILVLLLLGNTLNIDISFADGGYSSRSYVSFGRLTFNPFAFLLLVLYFLINRFSIRSHIKYLMHGSESEQKEKGEKLLVFYYEKFENFTNDELDSALGMFKDFPLEAQQALQRIKKERNLL
ncbi:MAG: hypothetical protein ABI113_12585 [Mucilaginibacter sp.]